ncbi:MAG: Eco29kI family restriction endonuclease [Bacteroidia bacterium]|nr:Eco29kI family restriction endonuclease [Bacteroidia bacterium]
MSLEERPFNPLDKQHLGESVAQALLDKPVSPLPPTPFNGAGIYAIYYTGPFSPYATIAARNADEKWAAPMYVGKAVPAGARKGGILQAADIGNVLWKRLREHADSISQADNLDLQDFACRYLAVDDIWIPLAESMLISKYRPIWNNLLDGFGNHDPGQGRTGQKISPWDLVHPGRPWASKLQPNQQGLHYWMLKIEQFLAQQP